jgi:hypothetical protein
MYQQKRMVRKHFDALTGAIADVAVIYMQLREKEKHIKVWLLRFKELCKQRPSEIMAVNGGLYILLCIDELDAYLGETGFFPDRRYDHVMDARRNKGQFVHGHMQRHGLHKFIMLPLLIENDETSRQLAEIWAIKTYQPRLNRRVDRLMPFMIVCDRIGRNQGRIRHRIRNTDKGDDTMMIAQRPVVYTLYELVGEGVHSTMLDSVLKIAKDRHIQDCMIEVTHGTHTIRPKGALTERFLDTVVSVQFSNCAWVKRDTLRSMRDRKVPLHQAILLVIHEIKEIVGLEVHKLFLTRVLRHPELLRDLQGSFSLALDLYKAAGLFRGQDTTRNLRIKISTWSRSRFGTCLGTFKAINLAYTNALHLKAIREYVFDIIAKLPIGIRGQRWMRENMKFAHERQTRIHELICNHRRAAKAHKEGNHYACRCAEQSMKYIR